MKIKYIIYLIILLAIIILTLIFGASPLMVPKIFFTSVNYITQETTTKLDFTMQHLIFILWLALPITHIIFKIKEA